MILQLQSSDLYNDRNWLFNQYVIQKKSIGEIARILLGDIKMTEKEVKKQKEIDRSLERFMLSPESIVILKKGGKTVCDPKDKTCKIEE